MKWFRRRYGFAAAIVIVLALLSVAGMARLGEPRFAGRSLSRWLEDPNASESEVRAAVRAMGTNAIPYLQKWLLKDVSWMEKRVRDVNARQNWYLFDYSPSIDANIRAMRGFLYLEELAEPAIPWLVAGMNRRDNNFMFYAKALVSSGETGRRALMEIYPDVSFNEKAQIVQAVCLHLRSRPELAWFYLQFIEDADPDIGIRAMLNLRPMKGKCPPELVDAIASIASSGPEPQRRSAQIVARDLVRYQADRVQSIELEPEE